MYKFIEAEWHFVDSDDSYEEIKHETHYLTLIEVLDLMKDWIQRHPGSYVDDMGFGIMEVCYDVSDELQVMAIINFEEEK